MILPFLLLAQVGAGSVQFSIRVRPETAYVGQQVTYEAVTLLDAAARASLRSNPSYVPGVVRGATVYDFPFDTAAVHDTTVGGTAYREYIYRRALFPLAPGRYDVPPATLQYRTADNGDFGADRAVALSSDSAHFVAVPLPRAGAPVGFSGAVGTYRDSLWTDGSPLRVGETFTATVRVAGVGNIDLLPRPTLTIDWATAVPGEARVQWDSAGTVVRGSKEFDWIVTPRVAGDMSIPELAYDYFDPSTGSYQSARTSPIRVTVAPSAGAAAGAPAVVRDTIGETPFPAMVGWLREHPLAIGVAVLLITVVVIAAAVASGISRDDEE